LPLWAGLGGGDAFLGVSEDGPELGGAVLDGDGGTHGWALDLLNLSAALPFLVFSRSKGCRGHEVMTSSCAGGRIDEPRLTERAGYEPGRERPDRRAYRSFCIPECSGVTQDNVWIALFSGRLVVCCILIYITDTPVHAKEDKQAKKRDNHVTNSKIGLPS
jgi:hypothetical protein